MADGIGKDELLDEIRRLADGRNNPPTAAEMKDNGNYSDTTYQNRFGSWNKALREAGYNPNVETTVTDTDLLEEIHRLAPNPNEPPTAQHFDEEGKFDRSRYVSRWGSWNNAVREAGYEVNKRGEITENELIHEIQRLAAELNRIPTTGEIEKKGKYAESLYWKHFGSWITALESAGFELEDSEVANRLYNAIPRKELLAEINRLAEDNNAPSLQRMQKEGKYSPGPYYNEFHSWWGAVVTAGFKPSSIRPLTPKEVDQYYNAVLSTSDPTDQLIGCLLMFTGLPTKIMPELSEDWIETTDDDTYIVTVPSRLLNDENTTPWKFLLPSTWTNPHTENTEQTKLPEIIKWYFNLYNRTITSGPNEVRRTSLRIAKRTELHDTREVINNSRLGDVPRVHPRDLRATHGIHLAQQGMPPDHIRRRLGMNHTNQKLNVSDYFVWLNTHESE